MLKNYARRRFKLLLVLVPHLLVPAWLIVQLAATGSQDTSTWLMQLFAAAAYVSYMALAGTWSWFGIYTQRAMPVVLVAVAVITRPRFISVTDSPEAAELRLIALGLGVLFAILTIWALLGRLSSRARALDLTFPLRGGTYIVGQGGGTRIVNRHTRSRSERYALDIVRLGRFGTRALGIYPLTLKKYAIFGAEVLSPCDGIVSAVVENQEDRVPFDRDPTSPAGNYIAIESGGVTIYLAHLLKGSATVDPGRRVRVGQILGRVGNSGNTTEPHLHIHAEREGFGVPMRFNGRFLVRNDLVET
jgi:Peptidase family M23